ncbi:MAG TPA: hypothetical protein VN372_07135 [Methanospirillum sp.]|nr:hypothetical protein [Methanospirillum sp.]
MMGEQRIRHGMTDIFRVDDIICSALVERFYRTGRYMAARCLSILKIHLVTLDKVDLTWEGNQSIGTVAAASEEQDPTVEKVTGTVNEFREMVLQTKESLNLAAANGESSATVDQIVQMVTQVTASMVSIRSKTEEADQAVNSTEKEMISFMVK